MKNKNKFLHTVEELMRKRIILFNNWMNSSENIKRESIGMLMRYSQKHFQYHLTALVCTAKSKENVELALENLRDEISGNHPKLGREFCKEIGIDLYKQMPDFERILLEIDSALESKPNAVFITGFLYLAEAYAPSVMGAMMSYARSKGLEENAYISAHSGPMEEHHVEILLQGLFAEVTEIGENFDEAIQGLLAWDKMINFIFNSVDVNSNWSLAV